MRKVPQLTEGPIVKALFTLAWPIILSNIMETAYNIVDAFWLGKLGAEALAAPTLSWPIVYLMISLGIGMGIAGTALVAQYTGARDQESANHAAGQTLAFLLLLAMILSAAGYLSARYILSLMGAEPGVLEKATTYMRIIFIGMPASFSFFAFTALLRGWGDTVTPMKLSFAAVSMNIILDPLLIFGPSFFPQWGVSGAAIATVVSRSSIAVVGLLLLFSGRVGLKLKLAHLKPDLRMIKKIITIGVPSSIGQSGTALGFSVLMGIVAHFGTATISAFGVGNRIINVMMMPAMGLGQATTTMVGQNLGSDKRERAERIVWVSIAIVMALLLFVGVISFTFREGLIRIFIDDLEVMQRGGELFRLISFALPFFGLLSVMMGTFQGAGHTLYSMSFELVRLWALRIPLAYFLGWSLNWGSDGVWWSMALSNLGSGLFAFACFLKGGWKEKVIAERKPAAEVSIDCEET